MPVIREYGDAKTSAPGPIQRREYTADMLGGAEGRALEQLGQSVQGVGEIVAKRLDQENTSDITTKMTKANADLAIKLQQTIRTADPGDKTVFENYQKEVDDTLGKLGEEARTSGARQFYQEASARIKSQLSQTAANGQAELAGAKAVQDYTETSNNLQTATLADPTSYGLQLQMHNAAIENLVANGSLPREVALKLKTKGDAEIAQGAIRGWAQLDADYAEKKLKSGEFDKFLDQDHKHQLFGEIREAKRAKEIDAERQDRIREKELKRQQTKTQNDFLNAMNEGQLTAKDILNSNLDPTGSGSKEQFLNMLKKMNDPEEKLKTDAGTMISLYDRIHLPDGDPKKLTDENELNQYFGRGLSFADLNRLRDEMQGTQTEAGKQEAEMKRQVIEIAKGKLTKSNPLTGLRDPVGDEQLAKWQASFLDEYKQRRAKGESARDLLDPSSSTYIGKNITQYVRSQKQIIRDLTKRAPPANSLTATTPNIQGAEAAQAPTRYQAPKKEALPRLPNESPADYLKRKKAAGG